MQPACSISWRYLFLINNWMCWGGILISAGRRGRETIWTDHNSDQILPENKVETTHLDTDSNVKDIAIGLNSKGGVRHKLSSSMLPNPFSEKDMMKIMGRIWAGCFLSFEHLISPPLREQLSQTAMHPNRDIRNSRPCLWAAKSPHAPTFGSCTTEVTHYKILRNSHGSLSMSKVHRLFQVRSAQATASQLLCSLPLDMTWVWSVPRCRREIPRKTWGYFSFWKGVQCLGLVWNTPAKIRTLGIYIFLCHTNSTPSAFLQKPRASILPLAFRASALR